jgi:hypothetical protein
LFDDLAEMCGGGSTCKGVIAMIQSMNEATNNREKKIHHSLIWSPINSSTHTTTKHKDVESGGMAVDEHRGDCYFIVLVMIELE